MYSLYIQMKGYSHIYSKVTDKEYAPKLICASGTYSRSECLGEVSSSSVSLLMVITLTAGLGESAMMMVCRCLSETAESCLTDASRLFRASPSEVWLSCVSTQLTSSTSFPLIIFGEINAECGILVFCNELLLQPKKQFVIFMIKIEKWYFSKIFCKTKQCKLSHVHGCNTLIHKRFENYNKLSLKYCCGLSLHTFLYVWYPNVYSCYSTGR